MNYPLDTPAQAQAVLKALRAAQGLSQAQVGELMGVNQKRIARIEGQLESVKKTRALHRKGRARVPYPVVALVGYTNAGKSTLFNRLTSADVLAEDKLFATLDPTMRDEFLEQIRQAKAAGKAIPAYVASTPTSCQMKRP